MSGSRAALAHAPVSQTGVQLAKHALASGGQALDGGTQSEMAQRFGHDFAKVRVHHGPAVRVAAAALGANAFTVGHHIGFPSPRVLRQSAGRRLLLHELVHVVQQSDRGQPCAGSEALEREAQRVALSGPSTAVGVRHAAPVSLACSREEWLQSSPDLSQRGFSEMVDDIDEIAQWLDRQTASTPEVDRLTEALSLLTAEVTRRTKKAGSARTKPRKKATKAKADTAEAVAQPPPRTLVEKSSVQFSSAKEMRAEVDHIVAWLQRDDVSAKDRQLLQVALHNLSPQFQQLRQQHTAQRRNQAVAQALAASESLADERMKVIDSVRRIDAIVPMSERPGYHALMRGSEVIVLDNAELAKLRSSVSDALDAAAKRARNMNEATFSDLNEHMKLNYEDQPYVGFAVSVVSGEEPVDLYNRVLPMVQNSNMAVTGLRDLAKKGGALTPQAEQLLNALEAAQQARGLLDQGVGRAMSAAGDIVSGLTVTRDLSFAISLSIGAIVAAPVVAAGVGLGGLGFTGASAVLATSVGTGAVVAGEGLALRGGSAFTGELMAGNSLDTALDAGKREGKAGAVQGATIGVGAGAGFQMARNLGVGVQALSRGQTILRTAAAGTAGGSSSGLAQGILEQRGFTETVKLTVKGGGLGTVGGLLSGGASVLQSPALRGVASIGGDAAFNAGATYVETGSGTEALKAAAVSVGTSGGLMAAQHPTVPTTAQVRAAAAGRWVRARSQSTAAAVMLATADLVPAVRAAPAEVAIVSPQRKSPSLPDQPLTVAGEPALVAPAAETATVPPIADAMASPKGKPAEVPLMVVPPSPTGREPRPGFTAHAGGVGDKFSYALVPVSPPLDVVPGRVMGQPMASPNEGGRAAAPPRVAQAVGEEPQRSDLGEVIHETTEGTASLGDEPLDRSSMGDPAELASPIDKATAAENTETPSPQRARPSISLPESLEAARAAGVPSEVLHSGTVLTRADFADVVPDQAPGRARPAPDLPPRVDELRRGVAGRRPTTAPDPTEVQHTELQADIDMTVSNIQAAGGTVTEVAINRRQRIGPGNAAETGSTRTRPDVQIAADLNGRRILIEYDRAPGTRSMDHAREILMRDPSAIVIVKIIGFEGRRRP